MVSFKVKKQEMLDVLKMLSVALPKGKAKSGAVAVEITVKDGKIELVIPGANFHIPCSSNGSCKLSILYIHLLHLIKTGKNNLIEAVITEKLLKIGNAEIGAMTTFFEDDKVLRSIALPINYKTVDILRLPQAGYTAEEIEFNNLTKKYNAAKEELENNISKAAKLLQTYGISAAEIEKLVHKKLYK